MNVNNLLTFDIEDNFTMDELVDQDDWEIYKLQVVENTRRILNLLERYETKATFFVLGKVAERHPEIVKMINRAEHELASHGYIHERASVLGMDGFRVDVQKSKEVLERQANSKIKGFRAMAFSITKETAWALDILKEEGLQYDSSILSSYLAQQAHFFSSYFNNSFQEVVPSSLLIASRHITFGGGIFFRLVPFFVIKNIVRFENAKGRRVTVYAHAWEFNKDQPRRNINKLQKIAQSPLTYTTPWKIEELIKQFSFTSIEQCLEK